MLFVMLKRTWLYRKFDAIRNLIFEIMARVESRQTHHQGLLIGIDQRQVNCETALGRVEHRQLQAENIFNSLSANDTSVLEGLLHLVQRAPADNALAESRQAALLREIRERSDASSDQLLSLARRLGKLADREDLAALATRMQALEQVSARLANLEQGISTRLDGLEQGMSTRIEALVQGVSTRIEGLEQGASAKLDHLAQRAAAMAEGSAAWRTALTRRLEESDRDRAARFHTLDKASGQRLDQLAESFASAQRELGTQLDLSPLRERVADGFDTLKKELSSLRLQVDKTRKADPESKLQNRLAALEAAMEARFDGIEVAVTALRERVVAQTGNGAQVKNGHDKHSAASQEPELGLIAHLAPMLPSRVALDIGANVGAYSSALLDAGFSVHAFEPNPPVLDKLRARLQGRPGFSAHGFALGSADGKQPLHLLKDVSANQVFVDSSFFSTLSAHPPPDGLEKAGDIEVPVRTLDSLHKHGLVPSECSYVKIDTEGFDLEVVRGMGADRYPMVSVEFWDKNLPLGQGAQNGLSDLVAEMQQRGYGFWVVLCRVWGDNDTVRFYCNNEKTFDRSWGNAFFFQDHALFAEAQRWCAKNLPAAELPADGPAVKKSSNGKHLAATP